MNTRRSLLLQSMQNGLVALDYPDFKIPELARLQEKLQASVEQIRNLSITQVVNRNIGADARKVELLRKDIRKRLIRLADLAIVELEGLPGINDDVRIPRTNATNEVLIEAAKRIIKNIRPHLKTLHKAGLPKDAIPQLQSSVNAMVAKMKDGDTVIARRSRATASLPDELRRGRKVIKAIDSTIKIEFADNPAALTRWAQMNRVPRKLGRPRKRKPPQAGA
jgi:hypothetical protein